MTNFLSFDILFDVINASEWYLWLFFNCFQIYEYGINCILYNLINEYM